MSDFTNKMIAAGWHEYCYPRPATDEPSDRFKRGLAAALRALDDAPVWPDELGELADEIERSRP